MSAFDDRRTKDFLVSLGPRDYPVQLLATGHFVTSVPEPHLVPPVLLTQLGFPCGVGLTLRLVKETGHTEPLGWMIRRPFEPVFGVRNEEGVVKCVLF